MSVPDVLDLDRLRDLVEDRIPGLSDDEWANRLHDFALELLAAVNGGGRLVVEQPCEHGVLEYMECEYQCPGGSRTVVWEGKDT